MHEGHVSAVLVAAIDGERVLVVLDHPESIRPLMEELESAFDGTAKELIRSVNRTNGGQRIDFDAGGSIRFRLPHRIHRSDRFDQVFVPIGTNANLINELVLSLDGSKVGLITGY